jgi:hypothetical protein
MVYTNENSGVWTSGDYINEESIYANIDAPDYTGPPTTQTIRATGPATATGWSNVPNAYDSLGTSVWATGSPSVAEGIIFTWEEASGDLPFDFVNIYIDLEVGNFATSNRKPDTWTLELYVGGSLVTPSESRTTNLARKTLSWTSVTDPGDDGWSLADLQTIQIIIGGTLNKASDELAAYFVYDVYVIVNP